MNASRIIRSRPLLPVLFAVLAAACSQDSSHPLRAGAPAAITLPAGEIFPESITSTADGSVIIGSIGTHQIFRAKPGAATAEPWIAPGTGGLQSVQGVLADDASDTLYVCSNVQAPAGSPSPDGVLHTFNLTTGAPQGRYPLPGKGAFCNDIAVDADGTAYATDSSNMQVVRLKKGASALEVWAGGAFGPANGALDGIAVLGNKRVIVSTFSSNRMFSVPIRPDGSAGTVTEVKLDRRLQAPDAIRGFGPDTLLMIERGFTGPLWRAVSLVRGGPGVLSKVKLTADSGTVTSLKRGYPDGAVSLTVVSTTAYVLEGQLDSFHHAAGTPQPPLKPFHATALEVGPASAEHDPHAITPSSGG